MIIIRHRLNRDSDSKAIQTARWIALEFAAKIQAMTKN
jgi:hypothetical protein